MNESKILLFGTGQMAYEYAKILKTQGHNFIVVGRGENSAKIFQKKTGMTPIIGGAEKFLSQKDSSKWKAIVAVSGDQLGQVATALIKHGIKVILLEKPGGLDEEEIKSVAQISTKYSAEVYIAYNRRFYTSVIKAAEIIKQDKGILSLSFDFSEISSNVVNLKKPYGVKENWLLHNSSHIIDLVFFFGGTPKEMTSFTSGSLTWHRKAAIFSGAGITNSGVLFAYHANWLAPGRWNLEIMTENHKLIFKPLERLQIQKKGSFEVKEVYLNDKLDKDFKPGLYREVESFLSNQQNLCTISEQTENLKFYKQILGR